MSRALNLVWEQSLADPAAKGGRRPLTAGESAVFARADGSVVWLARPLRLGEMWLSGYRTRDNVLMGDFEDETPINGELPTRDDTYYFDARLSIGFRVHDPAEVVRRRIGSEPLVFLHRRLVDTMRDVSRRYDIEDCQEAQDEINRLFGGRQLLYPEGLLVYRFSVYLSLDQAARDAQQRRRMAQRETGISRAEHERDLIKVRQEREVELERVAAVRQAMQGNQALLYLHLARHRDATREVLDAVVRSHEVSEEKRLGLLKMMLDEGLIQDVDLDGLREENLRHLLKSYREGAGGSLEQAATLEPEAVPPPAADAKPLASIGLVNLDDPGGSAEQDSAEPAQDYQQAAPPPSTPSRPAAPSGG